MRVVVLIKHTLREVCVSSVISSLRARQLPFSSVHTHLILRVCVPMRPLIGLAQNVLMDGMNAPYTKSGRLSDILALIQVLALDKYAHRSEAGVTDELQRMPSSSSSWVTLAREHPEFFRVRTKGEHVLSLVARHVTPENASEIRELNPELVQKLLGTAIDLHDRQIQAKEWWKSWIPLIAALLAALVATATTLLTLWLNGWCKP